MHAHRAIWARQMMFDGWYGLSIADRMLHAGAFNWTYTLGTGLTDPWTVGATALIPAPGTAPTELPSLIARHDVTIFAAAPGVYRQMLKTPFSAKTPALRHGLSAGEKLPLPVRAAWEAATGIQVYEAFGMSECSTFISASPSTPAKDGALGCAQPGRQVCILSDTRPAPAGTPGTIAIHKTDPGLMLGYYNAPDQTARRYSGDWFLTGDQGVLDADNQITYLGRADDMMNAGGFRVSPLEVEAVLLHAPGITGVGVTEVVVRDGVSIIAAFCTTNAPLDEAAVDAYAKAHLARYKQPRIILQVDSLPTGANGKLLRRKLRIDYEANN
jgi:acyl-coenzyme A synthetase/AMP-(fatty) acid ligase